MQFGYCLINILLNILKSKVVYFLINCKTVYLNHTILFLRRFNIFEVVCLIYYGYIITFIVFSIYELRFVTGI